MGVGFSIFLFVIGAILTFAVEVDTGSGFNLNTVGIILMVGAVSSASSLDVMPR